MVVMDTYIPLTEARNKLAKLVNDASKTFSRFTITRNGRPEVILISREEYDALIDTLEILSSRKSMASLQRAEEDVKEGRMRPLKDVIRDLKL